MSDLSVAFYKAVKRNSHCLVCDTKESVTFHHVEPDKKTAELGKMAHRGSLINLIDEFNKCVPLCWAHHKEVHNGQRIGWLNGLDDKGKISHPLIAQRYMPYIPFFIKRNPHPIREVYQTYILDPQRVFLQLL
jgi:hypothetical protein